MKNSTRMRTYDGSIKNIYPEVKTLTLPNKLVQWNISIEGKNCGGGTVKTYSEAYREASNYLADQGF